MGKTAVTRAVILAVNSPLRLVDPRPLKKKHVISPSDLVVRQLSLTQYGDGLMVQPEALVGKRMVRSVRRGTPIYGELVEEVPVVRRGDRVTLLLEAGALSIMALGQAKEDGILGQKIAVLNLDSKKVIYGEVADASTVRVHIFR